VRSIRLFGGLAAVAGIFACAATSALAGSPVFLVSGGGYGHGVGMSQYGAEGFALHGYTYRHILAHYYTGTTISRAGNSTVRVLLATGRNSVLIGSSGRFHISDARGRKFTLPAGGQRVSRWFSVLGKKHRRHLLRFPISFAPGPAPLTLDGASYRGSLTVSPGLDVVNSVPLESYLRGVVPAEMPSHWLRQALEVQAVAARSYALASLQPGAGYDVYPDQRSQMYLGIRAERASTDAAVAATAGQIVTWHGVVAKTYFSSTSGGRTAANEDAWPGSRPVPYLRSVSDPYDSISPYHRWRPVVLSAAGLGRRLGVGKVDDVEVTSAASGWAESVRVATPRGARTLAATAFANRLGLRSQAFRVGELRLDPAATRTVYGHAVALDALARGLQATLQSRRPGGGWHGMSLRSGRLEVRPLRTTEYRLSAANVTTQPVRIAVAPALVVSRSHRALSGRVAPAIGGLHVAVQRLLAGNWLTIRNARAGEDGAFRLDRGLPVGTYRVTTPATGLLLAGASSPIHLP
jgi:stage II sporulation protein D